MPESRFGCRTRAQSRSKVVVPFPLSEMTQTSAELVAMQIVEPSERGPDAYGWSRSVCVRLECGWMPLPACNATNLLVVLVSVCLEGGAGEWGGVAAKVKVVHQQSTLCPLARASEQWTLSCRPLGISCSCSPAASRLS